MFTSHLRFPLLLATVLLATPVLAEPVPLAESGPYGAALRLEASYPLVSTASSGRFERESCWMTGRSQLPPDTQWWVSDGHPDRTRGGTHWLLRWFPAVGAVR